MKDRPSGSDLAQLSADQKRALLKQLLQAKVEPDDGRLSYGQRALWFMSSLAPDSPAYNWVFRAVIRPEIDIVSLGKTFEYLIDRHEQLRSVVSLSAGEPVRRNSAPPAADVFAHTEASAYTEEELEHRVLEEIRRPFPLDRGPLVRVSVLSRSTREHILLIVAHHIVMDARSLEILLDEARDVYSSFVKGVDVTLPRGESTYRDFVRWQEAILAGDRGATLRRYWGEQLDGELPVLELPTARARPARRSFQGASHTFTLDADVAATSRKLARDEKTTLFVVFLSAFQAFLSRYTGQKDILVGTPMAGRTRPEFESIVGYFVNPVVIRANLTIDRPFREMIHQVRDKVIDAVAHQDYPFPLLVQQLHPHRDPSHSPIFQAMLDWHVLRSRDDARPRSTEADRLAIEPVVTPQQEGQFDISLDVFESEGGTLSCALKYDVDLLDAVTVDRMARHFQTLLRSALDDPDCSVSTLRLLNDGERRRMTHEWNDTDASYPRELCVHHLFERQAKATPATIAAVHGPRSMTYGELNSRASALASRLRAHGVGPNNPVGICVEPSLEMLVGLIGILKSGGAYLPLDPSYPRDRLQHMVRDSGARILLTQEASIEGLSDSVTSICLGSDPLDGGDPAAAPDALEGASDPEHLAYVIYTSGSTGKAKGVRVSHRNVVNLLCAMRRRPGIRPGDVLFAVTTISFDIHVLELFLPLMAGARVHLVDREILRDGRRLFREIRASGATIMQATPSGWQLLLDSGWNEKLDLKILCGGEPLTVQLARDLVERGREVWNMYGPTETTVWSSTYRVRGDEEVIPIGRPIDNTRFYVLDEAHEPVPIGVSGELFVGGDGVTKGYSNLEELTRQKFIPDPFSERDGARMYATGDVAHYRPDGIVEIHGRKDHQVKLRGFRIELGDVEAALRSHESVADAIALVRGDGIDRRLVGYVVSSLSSNASKASIGAHLKEQLPGYMVPSEIVWLDELPKAPNGKIDRSKLPLRPHAIVSADSNGAPSTSLEILLADIWQEVLALDRVGVYDNFFDLGGHSLLSMKVAHAVENKTGLVMDPQELVNQTLRQVAAKLERDGSPSQKRSGLKERLLRAVGRSRSSES